MPSSTPEPTAASRSILYVAAWTDGVHGSGGDGGVHVLELHRDGTTAPLGRLPQRDLNVGFLALGNGGQNLYVLDERKDLVAGTGAGSIVACSIDPETALPEIRGRISSVGPNPSYVSLDPTSGLLVTANHGNAHHAAVRLHEDPSVPGGFSAHLVEDDGSVTLVRVREDSLTCADVHVLERRSGPHPLHQRGSHPHSAVFDPSGRFVLVCDKGADQITVLRVDRRTEELRVASTTNVRPGSAPRHAVFHPQLPVVYVVCELESVVDVFTYDAGLALTHRQSIASTSRARHGDNHPSDLALDAHCRILVAANRGEGTVRSFISDAETGMLTAADEEDAGAERPRALALDPSGRAVLAACTEGNAVTRLALDLETGALGAPRVIARMSRPTRIAVHVQGRRTEVESPPGAAF